MPDAPLRGVDGFIVIMTDDKGQTTLRVCPVESEANDLAHDFARNGFRSAVVQGKLFRPTV